MYFYTYKHERERERERERECVCIYFCELICVCVCEIMCLCISSYFLTPRAVDLEPLSNPPLLSLTCIADPEAETVDVVLR
mmetsp:Transcript_22665/g.33789  ORF Transcript_22665/g.33789 Transcript_22665/m.33789 type:complete len:81 (-) Transcript_22665:176-418(-)